ncbi:MAG: class A beta-lactamase-related serine hydrolase [Candidatus Omnitrophica bacterium]|nr:class A beta-lactamase-related serine hydrolase [Candidatus Omnitrophota bacterium]
MVIKMIKIKFIAIGIFAVLLVSVFFFAGFTVFEFHQKNKLLADLGGKISDEAVKEKISYSLIVKDLTFPMVQLSYRQDKAVVAASLMKLPILGAAFKAAEEGKVSLDQIVTIEVKDITGGSGVLKTMPMPHKLTLESLLETMISASDNTATNKLIDLLGFDYLNKVFGELNLTETVLRRKMMDFSKRRQGVDNYTSAADISVILESIYDKKFINCQFSDLALKFLKKQKVNDRIPRYLPKDLTIAHKTGLERGVVHDAGIVFLPGGDYIITVLVDKAKGYVKPKKFIAQISRLAYNLYTGYSD